MKNKNIKFKIAICLLMASFLVMPIISADGPAGNPRTVAGYLYDPEDNLIDIDPSSDQITISINGNEYPGYVYDTSRYLIDFISLDDSIGDFNLINNGFSYTADETITTIEGKIEYFLDLHIDTETGGVDIQPPSKVDGLNVNDAKDGKLDVSWNQATDNDGIDHYDVYRDGSKITETSILSYKDAGLNNDQEYTYYIIAVDNSDLEGEPSDPASGTPTATSSNGGDDDDDDDDGGNGGNGGNGGGGGGTTDPVFIMPSGGGGESEATADADGSLSDTFGYIGDDVQFDGSRSTGSGTLTYLWDFGDGNKGSGEKPVHKYQTTGEYTITLTVTSGTASDTDTFTVTITNPPNNAPTKPDVTGTFTGSKNTEYSYTAVSTDIDEGDEIKYFFIWGDETTNSASEFVANGTSVTKTHTYTEPGVYVLKVTANDNKTDSLPTEKTVLIDTVLVTDKGYMTDDDGDGTYDTYHDNDDETLSTTTEKQTNGTYLIDSDKETGWNYYYYPDEDRLDNYAKQSADEPLDNTVWFMLIAGVIIAVILLAVIAMFYKKKK